MHEYNLIYWEKFIIWRDYGTKYTSVSNGSCANYPIITSNVLRNPSYITDLVKVRFKVD